MWNKIQQFFLSGWGMVIYIIIMITLLVMVVITYSDENINCTTATGVSTSGEVIFFTQCKFEER